MKKYVDALSIIEGAQNFIHFIAQIQDGGIHVYTLCIHDVYISRKSMNQQCLPDSVKIEEKALACPIAVMSSCILRGENSGKGRSQDGYRHSRRAIPNFRYRFRLNGNVVID
jgi:hypothetical protein